MSEFMTVLFISGPHWSFIVLRKLLNPVGLRHAVCYDWSHTDVDLNVLWFKNQYDLMKSNVTRHSEDRFWCDSFDFQADVH